MYSFRMFNLPSVLLCLLFPIAVLADTITLATGERLIGKITNLGEQQVTLQHPFLGELKIPVEKIDDIQRDKKAVPQAPAAAIAEPADGQIPTTPDAAPERFIDGWKAHLEIAGAGTSGNSETLNFRFGFNGEKETELDRWKFDTAYYYASDHHTVNKNEFTFGLDKDWLIIDSPWFYYTQGRYDYNEFQSWLHRVTAAGGLGYQLIKTDTLALQIRGGLGGAKEFGDSNELRPEAQFGAEGSWKINEWQMLKASTYYYPDLAEPEQYRIRSLLDWTLKLTAFDGLSLKFGLENEYQSYTEDDSLHNDFKAFGSLVIDF